MPKNSFVVRASKYDSRNYVFRTTQQDIRDSVDLRPWDSKVETQEQVGSCVGAAVVGAYELILKKNYPDKFVDLSKLYAYYHARLLEGTEYEDAGATLKNCLKGVQKFGVCPENLWPYNTDFWSVQPSLDCYNSGWPYKKIIYQTLYSLGDILEVLNSENPVIIGINVFDNFNSLDSKNAVVLEPEGVSENYGGHAMSLSGYSISKKFFIAKNSYGPEWGDSGYCYIPFDYMNQWCFDRWTFTTTLE